MQGLSREEYEAKKEQVADSLVERLEQFLPGLHAATVYREASFAVHIRTLGIDCSHLGEMPIFTHQTATLNKGRQDTVELHVDFNAQDCQML